MGDAAIEAVLWDADGVLQHGRRDWVEYFTEVGGPGFGEALFEAELPALRGEQSLRECVAGLLTERRLDLAVDDVLAQWREFDPDRDAFELIAQVRAAGTACYLATNQQDYRVRYMRVELGYDPHFDASYYSSEVGAMKPDAAFFQRVLDDLELTPSQTAFIDDNAGNITSAAELGIVALHHDPAHGVAGLRRLLTKAGVPH